MKAAILVGLVALLSSASLAAEPGPIAFSSEPGPALDIARTLMGEERGTPLTEDEKVTIGLVDLDNDGTRDIIAFADASFFCGSAGCVPRIYRLDRDTAQWTSLPIDTERFLNSAPADWSIAPGKAGTWWVLGVHLAEGEIYLAWNGKAYVEVQRKAPAN